MRVGVFIPISTAILLAVCSSHCSRRPCRFSLENREYFPQEICAVFFQQIQSNKRWSTRFDLSPKAFVISDLERERNEISINRIDVTRWRTRNDWRKSNWRMREQSRASILFWKSTLNKGKTMSVYRQFSSVRSRLLSIDLHRRSQVETKKTIFGGNQSIFVALI